MSVVYEQKSGLLVNLSSVIYNGQSLKTAPQWPKVVMYFDPPSGGCERVPPKLQGSGKHDPGAFGSSADGL